MRVVKSQHDPRRDLSDVRGEHTVVYPISSKEVVQALQFSEALGVKPLIRSGFRAARDEKVEGEGIVVINLRDLDDIRVKGEVVTVGVGATTAELASRLVAERLFLPLDADPDKSVVSNAMSTDQGYVGRSAGILSQFVTSVKYVTVSGEVSGSGFQDVPSDSVFTHIVFKAKTSDEVKDLVMITRVLEYDKNEFRKLLDEIFVKDKQLLSASGYDLTVRVFTGAFGSPMVSVTAACADSMTLNTLRAVVAKIGGDGALLYSADLLQEEEETTGVAVVEAIAEKGKGSTLHYEERRRQYASKFPSQEPSSFLDRYCDNIDRAVDVEKPCVRITSALRMEDDGKIVVTASLYMHADETQEERDLLTEFDTEMREPVLFVGPPPRPDSVGEARPRAFAAFATDYNASGVPDFKGEVIYKGDRTYEDKRKQYAWTSYRQEADHRMKPSMIAYPVDTADVIAIVKHAIEIEKKVVPRSGGHQYSGMSSGGDDTILISMDLINHLSVEDNIVVVGPGAILTNLSRELRKKRITIPHGECPKVAIGGHVQTGGYGHLLRSFGLALDYVKSFEIVLADSSGEVSSRTITRPALPVVPDNRSVDNFNSRIYWGVLGGGPGSFGIITSFEFECIRDTDHPNSVGYSAIYKYRKNTFASCMAIVKEYTEGIENGKLPADYDLMISALSGSWNPLRMESILVEMLHGNLGGKEQEVPPDVLDPYVGSIKSYEKAPGGFKGRKDLSYMTDSWVRHDGMTPDGREYPFPYKKRVNATKRALTPDFVNGFVDLIDKSIKTEGVKIVFQMTLGGGAYKDNAKKGITSIPHRDAVIGIVYDVFYDEGKEQKAEELQDKMQSLLSKFQDYDEQDEKEIRMIWGSFGDVDMNNVWKNYYGKNGPYKDLQELKKDADPLDIFTTSFTVQMPRGEKRPHRP